MEIRPSSASLARKDWAERGGSRSWNGAVLQKRPWMEEALNASGNASHRDALSGEVFPSLTGHVALTIDDGLCRSGSSSSMIAEVRQLLKDGALSACTIGVGQRLHVRSCCEEFGAKATFFLCSDYVDGFEDDAKGLLADGHEFANHCALE